MTSTFLIADVTGDWNRPTYPTPWSSAEHYVTDSLEPFGCDRSMAGGVGKECSERICPYGLVATANAHAADADAVYTPYGSADGAGAAVNGMHSYSECSAAGICDRAIGTCQCNDDRDGAACERSKCPNSCSFHGVCRTLSEVHSSGAALEEEDGLIGPTVAWNAGTYQQCDCDPGFFGGDCSLRRCPAGVNPFEECAEKSSFDIQQARVDAVLRVYKVVFLVLRCKLILGERSPALFFSRFSLWLAAVSCARQPRSISPPSPQILSSCLSSQRPWAPLSIRTPCRKTPRPMQFSERSRDCQTLPFRQCRSVLCSESVEYPVVPRDAVCAERAVLYLHLGTTVFGCCFM